MAAAQKRRKELRAELLLIEKQIFDLETNYLEETKEFGNIFSGWGAYISHEKAKQRKSILNEDRLFSLSSITSPASRKEDKKQQAAKTSDGAKRVYKKRTKAQQQQTTGDDDEASAAGDE